MPIVAHFRRERAPATEASTIQQMQAKRRRSCTTAFRAEYVTNGDRSYTPCLFTVGSVSTTRRNLVCSMNAESERSRRAANRQKAGSEGKTSTPSTRQATGRGGTENPSYAVSLHLPCVCVNRFFLLLSPSEVERSKLDFSSRELLYPKQDKVSRFVRIKLPPCRTFRVERIFLSPA